MIIYKGEPEEYVTFMTSEAYHALNEYMEFRTTHGEDITPKSWVLRDDFDVEKSSRGHAKLPRRLKPSGLKRFIERALWAQGLRKPLADGQKRHEFKADHGMRKYFKTFAEKSMKSLHVEILMGHSTGLADNYYCVFAKELLGEYLKAVNDLSLYDASKNKTKIERIEKELQKMQRYIADIMIDIGKENFEKIHLRNTDLKNNFKFSTDSDAIIIKDNDGSTLRY